MNKERPNSGNSMDILEFIPVGKENALHQEELANIMGIPCDRVKARVREARKKGAEILSGVCGYYLPKDDEERAAFVSMITKQAFTRLKTAKPIKSSLKEIKGQMRLSDVSEEGLKNEQ